MCKYVKYDNYDAINVDRVKDIPMDYYGVMGVPITFLGVYNPDQYEIIGMFNNYSEALCEENDFFCCGETMEVPHKDGKMIKFRGPIVNGEAIYIRILIKKKCDV